MEARFREKDKATSVLNTHNSQNVNLLYIKNTSKLQFKEKNTKKTLFLIYINKIYIIYSK